MNRKSVRDLDVQGKRVLVRVDFNVPVKNGEVTDDTRIRRALPTIQHLLSEGARPALISHLGRPKGEPDPKYAMDPVAKRLGELLGGPVTKLDTAVGQEVKDALDGLTGAWCSWRTRASTLARRRTTPGSRRSSQRLSTFT